MEIAFDDKTGDSQSPPILFITRFSFFGKSGWKSETSEDKKLLFSRDRLEQRLYLFENVTLPSLIAQTDHEFHHLVLSSSDLPNLVKTKLINLCKDGLGDRCSVVFRPYGRARKHLRHFMHSKFGKGLVAQVILDDDDRLSNDFVEHLRPLISKLMKQDSIPFFISFTHGYGLVHSEDSTKLYTHFYPFINLGLTMVSPSNATNILAISHNNAPKKFSHIKQNRPAVFVRSLHENNDSRVSVTSRWKELVNWEENPEIQARFPFVSTFGNMGQSNKSVDKQKN